MLFNSWERTGALPYNSRYLCHQRSGGGSVESGVVVVRFDGLRYGE